MYIPYLAGYGKEKIQIQRRLCLSWKIQPSTGKPAEKELELPDFLVLSPVFSGGTPTRSRNRFLMV
jgi:hypothetical protein